MFLSKDNHFGTCLSAQNTHDINVKKLDFHSNSGAQFNIHILIAHWFRLIRDTVHDTYISRTAL